MSSNSFIHPGMSALVTGASRGLGRALALALGSRGVRLVLLARGRAELDAVVAEVRGHGGEDRPHAGPSCRSRPDPKVRHRTAGDD